MSVSPSPPQKGWFGRNWLWVIPVGCGLPLLLCCGGCGTAGYFGLNALKTSDVFVQAVDKAKNDARVKQSLGEPITTGFWVGGTINVRNADGDANLVIPISGPNGSGVLNAVADKKGGGPWIYSTMTVTVANTGEIINLLAGP